jgi:hypothetical protein
LRHKVDTNMHTKSAVLDWQGLPVDSRFADKNVHYNHYSSECTRIHPGELHSDYEWKFATALRVQKLRSRKVGSWIEKQAGDKLSLDNMRQKWPQAGTARLFQPEVKIAAEPGISGSSEVFRTDTGRKPPGPQDYASQGWTGHADDPWNNGPTTNTKPTDARIPIGSDGHSLGEEGEKRSLGEDQRLARTKRHYNGVQRTSAVAGSR